MDEAKQTLDEKVDTFLDGQEKALTEPSTVEETQATDTKETEPALTDKDKTETGKVAEEEELPKEFHKHPAWQKILKQRNDARMEAEKLRGNLDPKQVEEFNKTVNTPQYIRASMEAQGFKPEAIDAQLKERGFEVAEKPDDTMGLIFSKLGVDPNTIDDNTKAVVKDIASVVDIMLEDRLGKKLPKTLEPIQDYISKTNRRENADKLSSTMEKEISDEGILDFKTDIEPALNKFIDDNIDKFNSGEMVQEDVKSYFDTLKHQLSIERLRTGKKKEERDEKKIGNRPVSAGIRNPVEGPKLTGKLDDDIDSFLNSRGIS